MESINKNVLRIGNPTSSEIYRLVGNGKKQGELSSRALTYIQEKNYERKLSRSIKNEVDAKPLIWGKLLENRVFNLLGIDYTLSSQETDQHPTIPFWAGSKDGIKFGEEKTVIDIKCPYTMKSFCELVDCETIEQVRENHKDGEKYYWQLVSNAIINDCDYAELIIYVPYLSELEEIRSDANEYGIKFIMYASQEELPYLIDDGFYKNINKIRFKVSNEDKALLTAKVLQAGTKLIKL